MADNVISPNMGLVIPLVGQEAGPQYAQDVNTSLFSIDAHDHSPGSGVQITPQGLNINADLTLNSNNLIGVRAIQFDSQVAPLPAVSPDIDALYVSGVDLYYNDGNGNQVRLTQGGNPAGGSGSITGLAPPASLSYSSGTSTFIFQSDVNKAANLDAGSIILRKLTTSSPGITLSPSSSLSSSYTITLPAVVPAGPAFLTMDASGNIGYQTTVGSGLAISGTTISVANGSITPGQLAPLNIIISSSSGANTIHDSVSDPVPNLTCTITTSGQPVMLMLQCDGDPNPANAGQINLDGTGSGGGCSAYMIFNRGATELSRQLLSVKAGALSSYPVGGFTFIDTPAAGTYTYRLIAAEFPSNAGQGVLNIDYIKLVAYEVS